MVAVSLKKFFFKQKTAYAIRICLVGSEMCKRDSPYWAHPKVSVWPHVSAQSNADSAAEQVADAIGKVFSGTVPNNLVSREQQY